MPLIYNFGSMASVRVPGSFVRFRNTSIEDPCVKEYLSWHYDNQIRSLLDKEVEGLLEDRGSYACHEDVETRAEFELRLTDLIRKMMFVSGDPAEPSAETAWMIETIVRNQVLLMVSHSRSSVFGCTVLNMVQSS